MKHPPKPSRKKLRAEIARLKWQVLALQVINRATLAVAQCQIEIMKAELVNRNAAGKYIPAGVVKMPSDRAYEAGDFVKI